MSGSLFKLEMGGNRCYTAIIEIHFVQEGGREVRKMNGYEGRLNILTISQGTRPGS
ncbi:hypothetical protein [Evansella clarkii]|uniref:hypothetical protein n=1 Tax=Evansella clarkii TaxID=79879 RepID=UPI001C47202C|nr:hypothetical protein [Evansella clarkii]